MTKELRKKYKFLKDLATLSKPDRRKYMSRISHHNIHIIGEAVYNALNGHCDKHKSKKTCRHLKELRKELLKLGNPKFNVEKKRKILAHQQSGAGVFSIIATTVLPFLLSLISKKKK